MSPLLSHRSPGPARGPATPAAKSAPRTTAKPARPKPAPVRRRAAALAWVWIGSIAGLFVAAAAALAVVWTSRPPLVAPRHRAEAVCFALAQRPAFDPPMRVESNAALVRGHFPPNTTVAIALQSAMNFSDEMVVEQARRTVGDFEVTAMWLRLPEAGGSTHWLVLGWVEAGDLAVCSFRFGGRGPVIGDDERRWGRRLLERVLQPGNFRAATLPDVRARIDEHQRLPSFGPPAAS